MQQAGKPSTHTYTAFRNSSDPAYLADLNNYSYQISCYTCLGCLRQTPLRVIATWMMIPLCTRSNLGRSDSGLSTSGCIPPIQVFTFTTRLWNLADWRRPQASHSQFCLLVVQCQYPWPPETQTPPAEMCLRISEAPTMSPPIDHTLSAARSRY